MTSSNNDLPNKEHLYGDFLKGQRWRTKLARKAAHKSLDIADDDVEINTDNSRRGMHPLVGLGIAALAGGLPLAALLAAGVFDPKPIIQPETKTETVIEEKTRTFDFEVGQPVVE